MRLKKILNRATSALLAGVMSLSAVPINAFASNSGQQTYAGSANASGLMQTILDSGTTYEMQINVSKNTTDAIKSEKSGSSGLGAWPATYVLNGVTGYAYCGDHSGAATTQRPMTIGIAYPNYLSADSRPEYNLATNIFYCGATGETRSPTYFINYVWAKAKELFPQISSTICTDADMQGLTEDEWRRATQYAIWSALPIAPGSQTMFLYMDEQRYWSGGQLMYDGPTGSTGNWRDVGYDYVQVHANNNDDSPGKRRIMATAIALRLVASYLLDSGENFQNRLPKADARFTEDAALGDFLAGSNAVDFTSAGEDGKNGTIEDAYNQITQNGQSPENGIYKTTYGGKEYYVMYFTYISKTQPVIPDGYTPITSATLSGDVPEGTIIAGTWGDSGGAGSDEWFLNGKLGLSKSEYSMFYDGYVTPGDSKTGWAKQYYGISAGEGDISTDDTKDGVTLMTDVGTKVCFPTYFKLMIPADSVTSAANINITFNTPSVYAYYLFLSSNADYNPKNQPFIVGDVSAGVQSTASVSWGEAQNQYYFKVYKESDDGKRLSGAEIKAVNTVTKTELEKTTDSKGEALFTYEEKDNVGDWQITEVKAPKDYIPLNLPVTVKNGEAGIVIKNSKEEPKTPEGVVSKLDAETGKALAGAVFNFKGISDSNGSVNADFTSNQNGEVPIQWWDPDGENYLKPGTYEVREKTPPTGYNKDDEDVRTITLEYDPVTEEATHNGPLIFENTKKPYIQIEKVNSKGQPLEGAIFDVYKDTKLIGTVGPTDASGRCEFVGANGEGLENGTYKFVEKVAPEGYLLNPEPQEINVNLTVENPVIEIGRLTFVNTENPSIVLTKKDAQTDDVLPGAVFKIEIDGHEIGQFTTNDAGMIVIDEETYGKYLGDSEKESWTVIATEITPPPGYILPDAEHRVWVGELKKGQVQLDIPLTNSRYPEIQIIKRDAETNEPLAGATFDIYIENQKLVGGPFTTDEQGMIRLTYDQYGSFLGDLTDPDKKWQIRVEEVSAPENYNKDEVKGGGWTQNATFTLGTNLVEFEYKDTSYRDIQITKKDADNGWLLGGAVYKLHCVSLAADANTTQKPADRTATTESGTGIALFENVPNGTYQITEVTPPEGYQGTDRVETVVVTSSSENVIKVEHENEPLTGLVIRKVDSVTKQPLANAKFTISGHLNDGSTFGPKEYYADANGLITIEDIKPGQYTIQEIAAPDGYVLDSTPKIITVTEQHQSTYYEFPNTAESMLYVLKLSSSTGLPVAGVRFSVSTAGGKHIADIVTGENGYATLPNLEPGGYVVKEIWAPDNMIVDPTPQTFEVEDDDSGRIYTLIFYNNEKTTLLLQKIDAETNKPLEGAYFTIRKGTGEEVAVNQRTDENGLILLENQDPGVYIVEEIKAPEGYILQEGEMRVVLEANTVKNVVIENSKKGGIMIQKVDADTDQSLGGATFELWDINDTRIGTYRDDDMDGSIFISGLEPGTYFVKEIKAPDGYILNDEMIKVTVRDFEMTTVRVENSSESLLTISKVDAQTGLPLADAKFEIQNLNGLVVKTGTTDSNGKLAITGLEPGWYNVVEIEAPNGYNLVERPTMVEIVEGKDATVTIKNVPKIGLWLKKADAETNAPLQGAVFEIYSVDGEFIGEYTTDASGTINTTELAPGHYKIREIKAPEGYLLDEEWYYFEMVEGETTRLNIKNWKETTIRIEKYDEVTGEPLAGAVFEVRTADGKRVIGQYTTDITGATYSLPVEPGAYVVEEVKAPAGYVLNEEIQPVNVEAGHMPEVVKFYNKPDGSTIIQKVDADTYEPLKGATFTLYDQDNTPIGNYTTGNDGIVVLPKLEPGTYSIKEVKAPEGYMIDNICRTVFVVKPGQTTTLTFTDTKKPGLQVIKVDSETGDPLAGATFSVYNMSGQEIKKLTTDESGIVIFTDLAKGVYIVRETQAPNGYTGDTTPKIISITGEESTVILTVENVKDSGLNIKKTDENGAPLAGAVFTVTRNSDGKVIGRFTSDATGCISVEGLETGSYTVTEIQAPEGYIIDTESKTIELTKGEPGYLSFVNVRESSIKIEKIDAETGEPIKGAIFEVKNSIGYVVGHYTTGLNGIVVTPALTNNYYTITEVSAPDGYILNSEPQTVKITGGNNVTVTFKNYKESSLLIKKIDKETGNTLSGAKFAVFLTNGDLIGDNYITDSNGEILITGLKAGSYFVTEIKAPTGYQSQTGGQIVQVTDGTAEITIENIKLPGLIINKIDSITKEPVGGATFSVENANGDVVFTGVTDDSGMLSVSTLDAGTYTVRETKAPTGYKLNSEPKIVTMDGSGKTLTFENEPMASMKIVKVDGLNKEPLPSASFEVRALDGTIVRHVTTDQAGLAFVSGLTEGAYQIVETDAPEGYILSGDHIDFYVSADSDNVLTVSNYMNAGIIIRKVDKGTGTLLQGAKFNVEKVDGSIAYTGTTDASGIIMTGPLDPGTYIVREISAPEGYLLDNTPQTIELKENETRTVEFQNSPLTSLLIEKVDSITKETLAGARFKITNVLTDEVITEGVTGIDGLCLVSDLEPGKYLVEEIVAPEGYIMDTDPIIADVKLGAVAHVSFFNTPMTGIIIDSVDSATGDPLGGSRFEVWEQNGGKLFDLTTDSTGRVQTTTLEPGWYVIKQVTVKDGYKILEKEKTVEVKAGNKPTYVTFESQAISNIVIRFEDAVTGVGVKGATFEVKQQNGKVIGEYTTETGGSVSTIPLDLGYYEVTIKSVPFGYGLIPETKTAEVTAGIQTTVTFKGNPSSSLVITAVDGNGKGIEGATFDVKNIDNSLVGSYTTDFTGSVIVSGIATGYYRVVQVSAPNGYEISDEEELVQVKANAMAEVKFINKAHNGAIIQTVDTNSNPVANVRIEIKKQNGVIVGEYVSDSTGMINVPTLTPGYYEITIITVPNGYSVETKTQTVNVTTDAVVRLKLNLVEQNNIKIHLTDAQTGAVISDAKFEVSEMGGNVIGQYTTDNTGYANSDKLNPGWYVVKQISTANGYTFEQTSKNVQIVSGSAVSVEFTNSKYSAIVLRNLNKADESPLGGAIFKLTTADGALVADYIVVGHDGTVTLPQLNAGYYVLTQTKAPDGFSLNTEPLQFKVGVGEADEINFYNTAKANLHIMSVDNNNKGIAGMKISITKQNGEKVGEYVTDNTGLVVISDVEPDWYVITEIEAPEGYVVNTESKTVQVKADSLTTVTFEHAQVYGLQILITVSQTGQPLEGATYSIEKLNGERMGTYTSDAQGLIYATLVPDTYVVTQTALPNGYEVESAPRNVTVKANGTTRIEYTVGQLSSVRLFITDSATGKGIYGMRFLLKTVNGELVGEYTTNDQGYIYLDKSLVDGYYTLELISTPQGYIVDKTPRTIQILNGETTEINWNFTSESGQIQVVTRSSDYNVMLDKDVDSLLAGAVFEIINPDTYVVVDTITTGVDGVAASNPLPIGRYIVKQKSAAPYYLVSDKEMEVKLKIQNDVVRVEYYNKSANISLSNTMKSNANVTAGSFMRVDFTAVNNASDTRLDDFYWHIKIPTDCARAGTLYTGIWNTRAWYTVSYKTNMNDYKEVSANLLSTNANNLDLSSTALGLMSGEYVTDIMVKFGTVPADFKVKATPALYLYVMPNVYNGYKCIVRSEIGGKIGTEWQTATATWTTNVIKQTNLPSQLPTTGF